MKVTKSRAERALDQPFDPRRSRKIDVLRVALDAPEDS